MSKAIVVTDLGFGDSGKGTMVDYFCEKTKAPWVVRYNGGAQAGHNVVFDNSTHTFSQLGSGSFRGAGTFLSEFMMWNPISLVHEALSFSDKIGTPVQRVLERVAIDVNAPIITPFHVVSNRIKEKARGNRRHGSCGKGVGELASDLVNFPDQVLRVKNFVDDQSGVTKILKSIQTRKLEELVSHRIRPEIIGEDAGILLGKDEPAKLCAAYIDMFEKLRFVKKGFLASLFKKGCDVVFEGSQGVLLDEWHGFHPHTTWDTIVPSKAVELLEAAKFSGEREVVGILRSFMTRHGAGPFPTETKESNIESVHEFNTKNEWQGDFRVGYFDFVLLKYAIEVVCHHCKIDTLAITHLDLFSRQFIPYTVRYKMGQRDFCDRLLPNWEHNLKYQEELGKVLSKAKPEYHRAFFDASEMLSEVQKRTGIKVAYGSYGTRAKDKKEF